jgi:hypothetical protein
MHNRRQVHYGGYRKHLPVAAGADALIVDRVSGVGVAEETQARDGPKELVADCPTEGPLSAEELCAGSMVGGTWGREVDEEGRYSHEGLGDGIAWILLIGNGQLREIVRIPTRMKEKVTQVPATALTMMLSDMLEVVWYWRFSISDDESIESC